MDPRTAAKVTAPDLLKAFNEGRGTDEPVDTEMLNVYVVKLIDGKAVETCEFVLEALDAALAEVAHHVRHGRGYDAVLLVDTEEPESFKAISAADD